MLPLLQETGIKKPKGLLNYEVTPATAFEWGKLESVQTGQDGAFRDANPEQDLIDLFYTLKPAYLGYACGLAHVPLCPKSGTQIKGSQ